MSKKYRSPRGAIDSYSAREVQRMIANASEDDAEDLRELRRDLWFDLEPR
jgi:hypothetical protein